MADDLTPTDIVIDALYNLEVVTFGDAEDNAPGGQFVRISEAGPAAIEALRPGIPQRVNAALGARNYDLLPSKTLAIIATAILGESEV